MIQPRFLLSVAIIVAVISINCNNCNAGITRIGDLLDSFDLNDDIDSFELDDDIDSFELDGRADLNNPIKWLKRQVRRLKRALIPIRENIAANNDSINALAVEVETNENNIEINAQNITSNEEDIEENAAAIAAGGGGGGGDLSSLEDLLDAALDEIADNAAAIANNTEDIADNAGNSR